MQKFRRGVVFGALAALVVMGTAFAATGQPVTSGPRYDRNPSVVQDARRTYLFFARSQQPCDRLTGCDADNSDYDLYLKTSTDNGRSFGPPTLVATNPDGAGPFRGRTIAATRTSDGTTYVFWASGANSIPTLFYVKETAPGSGTFTPTAVPVPGFASVGVFNVEAVAVGQTIYLYTEENGPPYGIYARTFNGVTNTVTGGPALVAESRHIPKAIVDRRGVFRMTFVDASAWPTVDVWVASSNDGLTWPAARQTRAVHTPGASNWDPTLAQLPNGTFVLPFAPDPGDGRQYIATTYSRDFENWERPVQVTPAEKDGVKYWDYWPEAFVRGGHAALFYTSERGFDGHPTGIGHIWFIDAPARGDGRHDDDDDRRGGHDRGGRQDDDRDD